MTLSLQPAPGRKWLPQGPVLRAMRILIDANVLFPTVMRSVVLGVAARGFFEPIWSARILEEWARAARKLGVEAEAQARAEIALLGRDWPRAIVDAPDGVMQRLWLPDSNDLHVLAAAINGRRFFHIIAHALCNQGHIAYDTG